MFGQMPSKEMRKAQFVSPLTNLPVDMRRMLRVQFKEFIHHIEDCESGVAASERPGSMCRVAQIDRPERLAS